MTINNTKFAEQLKTSQAYIKNLKGEIANLKANMKSAWPGQYPTNSMSNNNY
jgi:uncharacterized protein YukE